MDKQPSTDTYRRLVIEGVITQLGDSLTASGCQPPSKERPEETQSVKSPLTPLVESIKKEFTLKFTLRSAN